MRPILTIFSVIFFALTGIAQADVISDRKAGFRGNVAAMKKIQAAIGSVILPLSGKALWKSLTGLHA